MIRDGAELSGSLYGEVLDPREYLTRFYEADQIAVPPLNQVVRTATPLVARVNHGTWIFSCPCGAKGVPTPGGVVFMDYALGWCPRCQNGSTGRGWRPITVPDHETRRQIEAVLMCRALNSDRNWEPGETIADLIAQNVEHGEPVPDLHAIPEPRSEPTGAVGRWWGKIVRPRRILPPWRR